MSEITLPSSAVLPQEFSLRAYTAASEFEPQDWAANLAFRCYLQHVFRGDKRKAASYLIRNPLLSAASSAEYMSIAMGGDIFRSQLFDLSTFDALEAHDYFDDGDPMRKYAEMYETYWSDDPRASEEAFATLSEQPLWRAKRDVGVRDDESLLAIVVDLRAPDEILFEKFREWIRGARHQTGIEIGSRRVTDSDLRDMLHFRVLSYIDLLFWATAEGKHITNSQIGKALFPDEYAVDLAERVRKVVGPLARRVTNVQFVDAFHVQINAMRGDAKFTYLPDANKSFLDDPETAVFFLWNSGT